MFLGLFSIFHRIVNAISTQRKSSPISTWPLLQWRIKNPLVTMWIYTHSSGTLSNLPLGPVLCLLWILPFISRSIILHTARLFFSSFVSSKLLFIVHAQFGWEMFIERYFRRIGSTHKRCYFPVSNLPEWRDVSVHRILVTLTSHVVSDLCVSCLVCVVAYRCMLLSSRYSPVSFM